MAVPPLMTFCEAGVTAPCPPLADAVTVYTGVTAATRLATLTLPRPVAKSQPAFAAYAGCELDVDVDRMPHGSEPQLLPLDTFE